MNDDGKHQLLRPSMKSCFPKNTAVKLWRLSCNWSICVWHMLANVHDILTFYFISRILLSGSFLVHHLCSNRIASVKETGFCEVYREHVSQKKRAWSEQERDSVNYTGHTCEQVSIIPPSSWCVCCTLLASSAAARCRAHSSGFSSRKPLWSAATAACQRSPPVSGIRLHYLEYKCVNI